ncbi:hypothetical protein [Saccharopolyspora cebuensis]|uniref:SHOCT domain-containing protein n=1 Tax=Saccharopolyspora cebuensis TaxID=418759 RepID=A0ABV4CUX7_9PSEU
MTWQDELQNLDAELAAGRISAEEYRQRRDAVLGRAQNGPSSGGFPQQGPNSGGFPQQGPNSGGVPQQNPFPPAFSWGEAAQAAQQDNSTQVVPNPNSESTQVVNVGQQGWGQQAAWGPQQSSWGNESGSTNTPWGGSDMPPPPPPQDRGTEPAWMRQGPEVFESAGKSKKGLWVGVSIGAVLVVVLVVAGVFYFTSGGEEPDPQAQQTQQAPPPPPTPELPAPPAAKPAPPGSAEALIPAPGPPHTWSGPLDVPALQGAKGGLLIPEVLEPALQAGLVDGWFNGSDPNAPAPRVTLLAFQMPDEQAALDVVENYMDRQTGLSEVDDLSYQGVPVVTTGDTFRTAYVGHQWAVIVDVSADQDAQAKQVFDDLLTQQLNHLPPTYLGE